MDDHIHMYTILTLAFTSGVLAFWVRAVCRQLDRVIEKHNQLAVMLTTIVSEVVEDKQDD